MSDNKIPTAFGSPEPDTAGTRRSRRKFLQAAAAAGAVAATVPISVMAQAHPDKPRSRPADAIETVLTRYGSEFGNLKQIR